MTTAIVESKVLSYDGDHRKRVTRKIRWAFDSDAFSTHRFSIPSTPEMERSRTFILDANVVNIVLDVSRSVVVTLQLGPDSSPTKQASFIVPKLAVFPLQSDVALSDTWDTLKVSRMASDTDSKDLQVHLVLANRNVA